MSRKTTIFILGSLISSLSLVAMDNQNAQTDSVGRLRQAINNEDLAAVTQLCAHPKAGEMFSVSCPSQLGPESSMTTLLHWAVRRKENSTMIAIVRALLGCIDRDIRDPYGHTPLQDALRERKYGVARVLADEYRADVNALRGNSGTALDAATFWPDLSAVRFLVRRGARVDIVNAGGDAPIHTIVKKCSQPDDAQIIKLLLMRGSAKIKDRHGDTPLHLAVRHNSEIALKAILEGALDKSRDLIIMLDDWGRSVLQCAIESEVDATLLTLLLDHVRDLENTKDSYGTTMPRCAIRALNCKALEMLLNRMPDLAPDTLEALLTFAQNNKPSYVEGGLQRYYHRGPSYEPFERQVERERDAVIKLLASRLPLRAIPLSSFSASLAVRGRISPAP